MISKGRKNILKFIFQVSISIILIAYFFWESYWFQKVGLAFIKWHTHLAFPILLLMSIYFFLFILEAITKKRLSVFKNIYLIFFNTFLIVFLLELFFVVTPFYKTRTELYSGFYSSLYSLNYRNIYHTWIPALKSHHIKTEEYDYIRETNSEGYSDKEWNRTDKSKIRILCAGDSFTEGAGAPQDSCYPTLLQQILDNKYPNKYEVMNAGTCGSDPFFNYKAYSSFLYKYHPNFILQTISSNDILSDYAIRGGLERFQKNNTLKYRKSPFWEPLYAISYVSRIFFNMVGGVAETSPKIESIPNMEKDFTQLFEQYNKECEKKQCELIICILPMKHEVKDSKYSLDISFLKNIDNTFDLLQIYTDSFHIKTKNYQEYYWVKDGHHNSKGYSLMAQSIAEYIFRNEVSYKSIK